MATASGGIAAANLKGHTMHSSVGLGINQIRLPVHIMKPSEKLRAKWDPVICVVGRVVNDRHRLLRIVGRSFAKTQGQQRAFRGLLAVFMFDFFQLLTVRGTPLFKKDDPRIPYTGLQAHGAQLYQSIDKAVYLTQNMRVTDDPEWGAWLEKARMGDWVPQLRAFLRQAAPPPAEGIHGRFVQVVSTDNAFRKHVNDAAILTACQKLMPTRKVYAIPAQLPVAITAGKMTQVTTMPDSQTGNIAAFLKIYIGMSVRVKSYQCIPKGVANGAANTIFHIDWRTATTFQRKEDNVWIASAPPTNIYVKIDSNATSTRFPGTPMEWSALIMPILQSRTSFKLRRESISIKGFPIVPAFGITVHGVQGDTIDHIVISDLRSPHCRTVDRHALYVSL
ncbi:unnamed protein product [Phytophthora fragariaefolia]|uniref:ATP-dependent DNA helicase n=1 Tax=Phytophthora fragariaefolia TaxID=1490495 RepID=A0A9W6XVW5_9STRA|nr:unnamed protein product [Phytophthora fragariaefolia]